MVNDAQDRIKKIRDQIAQCAMQTGRSDKEIKLVGVSKTRTVEEMLEVIPWVDAVGENRVQEAGAKKEIWPTDVSVEWRLIGQLQSNKVRKALSLFDTLDSIDSLSLARTVERVASEMERSVPVLIEVNTSGEASKAGVAPGEFLELFEEVLNCPHLQLKGFMTIGPLTENETQVRKAFAQLREIRDKAESRAGRLFPVLSMGMSGDFKWAIKEGSTMVRIGTAIFGSR